MRNPLVVMSVLMLSPLLLAAAERDPDEVCRLVPVHKPAADVAYQPGVDVNGDAVAAADLPSSGGITLPAEIGIDLRIPLADVLGADTPPFLGDAGIDVGQVTVDRQTGALFYNGKRLDAPYAVLCEPAED
ncbi:MAG: hypothetical protein P1U65_02285 [Minwuia sp.]|nr:hypothetical protein [Minwuia sp.]